MKITLVKKYNYVVRFYDENDNQIGYATCNHNELEELKKTKEFCGKTVHRTENNRV